MDRIFNMKKLFSTLIVFIIILPVAAMAMPPHPKLIEEWKEKGILTEKINDYIQKTLTLKSKTLKTSSVPQKSFPPTGTDNKICVLLVQYSDASIDLNSDINFYSDLFNGGGSTTLSLKKYYQDMSKNSLTLQFDVYGPYTAAKTHDYYGTDIAGYKYPGFFRNHKPPAFQYLIIAAITGFIIASIIFLLERKEKKIRTTVLILSLISAFFIYPYGCSGGSDSSSSGKTATPVEGNDAHPAELVISAVNAANNAGVDFSQYDNDGDGYVDTVIVIHQGPGQEVSGISTDIWSHKWDLSSAKYYGDGTGPVSVDGVTVKVYTMQPEFTDSAGDSSIGVFAHEMGHVLGLPDLYDVYYDTNGVGDWSLMASGSWCGSGSSYDGTRPAPLLAWERFKVGGTDWLTITEITDDLTDVSIDNIETGYTVYKVTLDSSSGQYLLLEGKELSASNEWTVRGTGILVTHIHEGIISDYSDSNTVNTGYDRVHGVNIVEADGGDDLWKINDYGKASDLFDTGVNQLTDSTDPDTKYYTSGLTISKTGISGVSITGINTDNSTMTFNIEISP